jgi:hypothetical protein
MAMTYANGRGVPGRSDARRFWLNRAAEQGHILAQINLAHLYMQGKGVPHDELQGIVGSGERRKRVISRRNFALAVISRDTHSPFSDHKQPCSGWNGPAQQDHAEALA